ncbi:tryptophan synthase beta subunit-like PLP-dependent enzyme [Coprinopsis sp. MPI-PUGE-AT-0042]|nr:tryptophan synthase beta subunit-like PLP-dependent enzyme [Coprinopsis sp. MPI-PUGE-AT-0042]
MTQGTVDPNSTEPLWLETPLLYSTHLSETLGSGVYLKLENLQPSHSFKYRGMSHLIQVKRRELGPDAHFVIASGGNAGLALACAARRCGLKCTVFIPTGVSESTLALLKRERAEVVVAGSFYQEAHRAAGELVAKDPKAVLVHAYNESLLWEGHGSMVKEIAKQIPKKPDAIFCSVGGGGLFGGILSGCEAVGWDDVPMVTLETIGSDCFYHSMSLNNGRFNGERKTLPPNVELVHDSEYNIDMAHFLKFNSKASGSLGASLPAEGVLRKALDWKGGVKSISVPDELSMEAAALFADNQKMLVELSCSTTLVPAYHKELFDKLVPAKPSGEERVVVFIVCGGFKTSVQDIAEYREALKECSRASEEPWSVRYDDGSLFNFPK